MIVMHTKAFPHRVYVTLQRKQKDQEKKKISVGIIFGMTETEMDLEILGENHSGGKDS